MQSRHGLAYSAIKRRANEVLAFAADPLEKAWLAHIRQRNLPARDTAVREGVLTLLFLQLALRSRNKTTSNGTEAIALADAPGSVLDRLSTSPASSLVRSLTEGCEALWFLQAQHPSTTVAWSIVDRFFGDDRRSCAPELPSFLVQAIVPSQDRRRLGEFYTPPWLVARVLELVRWPPAWPHAATMVDPTCGAGAFVVGAVQALRASIPESIPADQALRHVLSCVAGFDISPLAVLGARAGLYASIADLLGDGPVPSLPIRVRDLTSGNPIDAADFVAGNPPWVRWSDLGPDQQASVGTWARHYGLVPTHAFHGGSELDASAVFTYLALDRNLTAGGRAALVLPASLLRAPASRGFRRMELPDGTPLGLDYVADFGSERVFPGAANRTIVMCWTKGTHTREAFPFDTFRNAEATPDTSLVRSRGMGCRVGTELRICSSAATGSMVGKLLDGKTTWAQGRKGVTTDLNGAYFVRIVRADDRTGRVHVVNDVARRGHAIPVHEFEVERELVFPLVKGASQIRAFRVVAHSSGVIVPNRSLRRGLDESEFRRRYPAAYEHFAWVERETQGALSRRSTFRRMLAPSGAPFFFIYNVGPYTFSPFKVVWAEIATKLEAAVATTATLWPGGAPLVVVPDHKVYMAAVGDETSADFLCALLNSGPVRSFVNAVTEKLQVGALLGRIALPRFDPKDAACASIASMGARARIEGSEGLDVTRLEERVTALITRSRA